MGEGEACIQGGDPCAFPAGELGKPGIRDLPVAGEAPWVHFLVGEAGIPKHMIRVACDGFKALPGLCDGRPRVGEQMKAKECSLRE